LGRQTWVRCADPWPHFSGHLLRGRMPTDPHLDLGSRLRRQVHRPRPQRRLRERHAGGRRCRAASSAGRTRCPHRLWRRRPRPPQLLRSPQTVGHGGSGCTNADGAAQLARDLYRTTRTFRGPRPASAQATERFSTESTEATAGATVRAAARVATPAQRGASDGDGSAADELGQEDECSFIFEDRSAAPSERYFGYDSDNESACGSDRGIGTSGNTAAIAGGAASKLLLAARRLKEGRPPSGTSAAVRTEEDWARETLRSLASERRYPRVVPDGSRSVAHK